MVNSATQPISDKTYSNVAHLTDWVRQTPPQGVEQAADDFSHKIIDAGPSAVGIFPSVEPETPPPLNAVSYKMDKGKAAYLTWEICRISQSAVHSYPALKYNLYTGAFPGLNSDSITHFTNTEVLTNFTTTAVKTVNAAWHDEHLPDSVRDKLRNAFHHVDQDTLLETEDPIKEVAIPKFYRQRFFSGNKHLTRAVDAWSNRRDMIVKRVFAARDTNLNLESVTNPAPLTLS